MVMEAVGGTWGPKARNTFAAIAHSAAKLTGDPVSTKLEQIYPLLSVTFWRANARSIIRRPFHVPATGLTARESARSAIQRYESLSLMQLDQ